MGGRFHRSDRDYADRLRRGAPRVTSRTNHESGCPDGQRAEDYKAAIQRNGGVSPCTHGLVFCPECFPCICGDDVVDVDVAATITIGG